MAGIGSSPRSSFWPPLQLVLLARAVERGLRQQPVVMLDLDRRRLSRQLIAEADNTQERRVRFYVDSMEEVRTLLDKGEARQAVVVPSGFARELARPDVANSGSSTAQSIQVIVDGTNTVAASVTLGTAAGVVERFSAGLAAIFGLSAPEFIDLHTSI